MTAIQRSMSNHGVGYPSSFSNLGTISNLIEEVFRDFGDVGVARPWTTMVSSPTPALDIHETADGYVVKCDVPGVDPKDIALEIEDDIVKIKARRKSDPQDRTDGYRYSERTFGHIHSAVPS